MLTVTDAKIATSAGLDCLVLTWTCALGVQLLIPVTILGSALCEPLPALTRPMHDDMCGLGMQLLIPVTILGSALCELFC